MFDNEPGRIHVISRKQFVTEKKYRETFGEEEDGVAALERKQESVTKRETHSLLQEQPKKQKLKKSTLKQTTTRTTANHFLVGRKLCLEWASLDCNNIQNKAYGHVTECEINLQTGDVVNCTVVYTDESRDNTNNGHFLSVPHLQQMPPPLVLGGCIRYQQETTHTSVLLNDIRHLYPFWNWMVPDCREEELVNNGLPRLTIQVRDHVLEFNVRPSTIPNAGNGVFVKCKSQQEEGSKSPFILKAGELVDLGVYAPFREDDVKLEAVFFCKNFVHAAKCQEWAFGASSCTDEENDDSMNHYQLDITDDMTGTVHDEAKKHIPAYVNESNDEACINIRAEHAPDSSVHYLLGHANKCQGDLVIPCVTKEQEVFINYGDGYEEVRVRKGYSFLKDEEKRKHFQTIIEQEDVANVKEMDSFTLQEIQACVSFFANLLLTSGDNNTECSMTRDVVLRSLTCMVVLHRRAWQFFLQEQQHDAESGGGGGGVDTKLSLELASANVIQVLSEMMDNTTAIKEELQALLSAGNVDGLFRRVLELQFSEDELLKLAPIL